MKKIVIASDSFKGSVTSLEIAHEAEQAILKIFPECQVIKIPVADGGEGTVEALVSSMNGKLVYRRVQGPLEEQTVASYGLINSGKTAVLEMASASGLALLSQDRRNPMCTTTYGTGELIKDALSQGCTDFLIGIGGSATNDAGTGMLQALGFQFLDKTGQVLGKGGEILEHIHSIDRSDVAEELQMARFRIACDVKNPFYGPNGAAYIYGRQKGASEEMIERLDSGLRNFASVIKKEAQLDINAIAGSAAAGGMGGGFVAFLNAELVPGTELILNTIRFDELIEGADLIITGEGKIDHQTGMGKAPLGILHSGRRQAIPVIAIAGNVQDVEELNNRGFLAVFSILPFPVNIEEAMKKEFTCANIRRTLEQQLRIIREFKN